VCPKFVNRLPSKAEFWKTLNTPEWLLELIANGVKIPFEKIPPSFHLKNNRSVDEPENIRWVQDTVR
jgi:hypothetical protein